MAHDKIILEFSLNKHPLSALIPKVVKGEYSHVSVVWDKNTLFSARFKHGVGSHNLNTDNYIKQEYWGIKANSSAVKKWLLSQEGKGYDNHGVLRFISMFYFFQPSDSRFFCSELAFIASFVINPYFSSNFSRINPSTIDVLTLRQMLCFESEMENPNVEYLGTELTREML
jgi:hypothetical protein